MGIAGRLQRHAPHDHLVQLYLDPVELGEAVSRHLASGFDAGEPGIVVATPEHWALFAEQLRALGHDAGKLEVAGELVVLDADETLGRIMASGRPSQSRFDEVVGGVMDQLAPDGAPSIRAYGEMVDLLWQRGEIEAAAELEDLWNRLASLRRFSLLCGYKVDVFDRDAQVAVLPMICETHSHVDPVGGSKRLEQAVDAALAETLGQHDVDKVYALVSDQLRRGAVPASQLALMWVSAHMPRTAERILESAQLHFDAA